jgi:hypothetical protein
MNLITGFFPIESGVFFFDGLGFFTLGLFGPMVSAVFVVTTPDKDKTAADSSITDWIPVVPSSIEISSALIFVSASGCNELHLY